ncbi:hypothetical protein J4226_01450 [Candidatus Pacearchaeota archaeon]|nr:hypothetical protein [Candidatus Pacearchaeota archaeon]
MINDSENQRMELAKSTTVGTNCIGTVLYVLGILDSDTYVGSGERRWESGIVDGLLKQMIKIDNPKEGAILVIRKNRIGHMGIIVQETPPLVYHRPGINKAIKSATPLNEVLNTYSHYPIKEFYIKSSPR